MFIASFFTKIVQCYNLFLQKWVVAVTFFGEKSVIAVTDLCFTTLANLLHNRLRFIIFA